MLHLHIFTHEKHNREPLENNALVVLQHQKRCINLNNKYMKQKIFTFLLLACSFLAIRAQETSGEVLVNLWNEEVVFGNDWKANVTLDAAVFSNAAAGDDIVVSVSAISADVNWPQVMLNSNTSGWPQFEGVSPAQLKNLTAPTSVRFTITETMLDTIQASGLKVRGIGFTLSGIDLAKKVQPTVDVTLNLWKGETVCTDDWQGYEILEASSFTNAEVGNEIIVSVSAISETCQWPQVMLNDRDWKQLVDTEAFLLGNTAPTEARFTITENMLAEIKERGMVVKGCGFTMTSIDLFKKVETGGDEEKGDAVNTIWTGNEVISWSAPNNNSVRIDKSKFAEAEVGFKLRMNFTNLQKSAQGQLNDGNWQKIDNVSPLSGTYFEFDITEEILAKLQESGAVISGIGFTLTSVDIINPAKMYNIVLEYDRDDIRAWEPGETPVLHVSLTSLEAQDVTTTVRLSLMTDAYVYFKDYSKEVTLKPGEKQTVAMEMELTPGFYRMTANANLTDICSYVIGYDPTGIVSESTAEDDFWTFWDNALAELKGIDPQYTFVKKMEDKCTENRDVWEISMKSVPDVRGGEPVTIRAYYAEPKKDGKYPAIINFQGTDGGTSTPWCMGGDDNPEWCELILSTRGQMLCNRQPYEADNVYGKDPETGKTDYYAYEFGDTASHYYRGAYIDCVRAIDFLVSREKVSAKNIFAAGGSQGGSFTYAAAALGEGRIRAAAPSITGHADFVDDMKIVGWPANVFKQCQEELGITDEEMYWFLSYFDVMNFAERITCPVTTNFSLQDTTDPPHVNIAPYNLLENVDEADKEYSINPFKGHSAADNWKETYMKFFKRYIDLDEQPSSITEELQSNNVSVTTSGMNILVNGAKKNTEVKIYTAEGTMLKTSTDNIIPMEQHGFYIVTANNNSYKIIL